MEKLDYVHLKRNDYQQESEAQPHAYLDANFKSTNIY